MQNEILLRKQEEERWKDIPDWKRSLIIEKEKKKQEELVRYFYADLHNSFKQLAIWLVYLLLVILSL